MTENESVGRSSGRPSRYGAVTPWIISADTNAEIAFLGTVFGATETPGSRMLDGDGDIGHVEVELDGSVIMLFDAKPGWPKTPAHLRVYCADVDHTVKVAVEQGARIVTEPTDLPFGERIARLRDLQGHLWWVHQVIEQVSPDDLMARFSDPAAQERMAYVQATLGEELTSAD